MDEKLIIGIISGLIGAIITYILAILKLRKELEIKYDTDLRDKRIPEYKELWKLLEDLAKYARPKQLTVDDLHKLTASLRQWYFEKGGSLSFRQQQGYILCLAGSDQRGSGWPQPGT